MHLELGKHKLKPEFDTLFDAAICTYKKGLEECFLQPLKALQCAAQEIRADPDEMCEPLTEGWAHPKARTCFRMTPTVAGMLEGIFDRGVTDKSQRKDPKAIITMMKESGIPRENIPNRQQILGFFSRVAALRRKRGW